MTGPDWARLWTDAVPWSSYLRPTMEYAQLRMGVLRQAAPPAWAVDALRRVAPVRLLLLTHDWCWDEANSMPWLARLVDEVPGCEFRTILRDEHPEVMDRFLTNGTRSIPIVFAMDIDGRFLGHWGPRPAELQTWVLANKDTMPKDRRYAEMRRWYIKDKGESTLRELLTAMKAS